MSDLTITLTNRRPVAITKAEWPILAEARDSWHDNEYECQANRKKSWRLVVRERKTESYTKYLVYGVFTSTSAWREEANRDERAGGLLDHPETHYGTIVSEIEDVARRLGKQSDEEEKFAQLARECVGNLPAEVL